MTHLRKKTALHLRFSKLALFLGKLMCRQISSSAIFARNERNYQYSQYSRILKLTCSFLVVAFALQSGHIHGAEIVRTAPVAGKVADTKRAEDRLSLEAFAEPPVKGKPPSVLRLNALDLLSGDGEYDRFQAACGCPDLIAGWAARFAAAQLAGSRESRSHGRVTGRRSITSRR